VIRRGKLKADSADDFLAKAIRYAKEQWCLDDDEVVREWCERRADCDTPETLVDDAAMRYGLIHSTDDVGPARVAKQLMDEYKDVIGKKLKAAVLARLPS
jgi:hypothetical protein